MRDYYVTSVGGEEIVFEVLNPDIEQEESMNAVRDRGYAVITFKAYIRPTWVAEYFDEEGILGEYVGYLRTAYIPHERWEERIPTVWHHAQKFDGRYLGVQPPDDPNALYDYFSRQWFARNWPSADELTVEEKMDYVKKHVDIDRLQEAALHDYEGIVDKPVVDYIRVFKPWQRRGIAFALYEFAARYLAKEKGLRLYASGLQQPPARDAWDWMEWDLAYPTGREWFENRRNPYYSKSRRFLDYTSEYQ